MFLAAFILVMLLLVILFIEDGYRRKLSQKYVSKWMPSLPVIGCAYLLISENYFHVFEKYSRKFKEPFYFRIWFQEHYFTQHPEEIKEILTNPKTIDKGYIYSLLQWIIPDSLLIAPEAIWRKKRRCLAKGFNQRRLNALVPAFDKSCNTLIESLQTVKDVPLLELLEKNLMDTFAKTMIGFDVNEAEDDIRFLYNDPDLYTFIKTVESTAITRYIKIWLYFDFIYFNTKEGKDHQVKLMKLTKLVKYVVDNRRKLMKIRGDEYTDEMEKNLVDLMLEASLDEKDMLVDILLIAAAAIGTSGITLALTLTLLGIYPDIQDKVYKEVVEVTGNNNSLNHTDLVKLKYTEMVLNETMRLFPALPFIVRLATDDINLGDKVIPRNTNLMVGIASVHHSEKYWKDPMRYDPDRFLPEEMEKRVPFTFLPFSTGPRNCIGQKFGMLLMKTIIVKMVKKFQITSNTKCIDDIKVESQILVVVKEGLHCNLQPRFKV